MNVQLQSRVLSRHKTTARIVFFEAAREDSSYFEQQFWGLASSHGNPLDPDHVMQAEDAEIVAISLGSRITAEMLRSLPGLKLIATRSSSLDHIDLRACKQKRITVCNVPTYGARAVAEFTLGLVLALAHRIEEGARRVRESHQFNSLGLRGFNLENKTLGVIGTGHIGREVIRLAKAFGMQVLACDIRPDQDLANSCKFSYVTLPELMRHSDVITLHVPYYEGTHHLLNHSNLKLLRPGTLLVNTSRGAVIETQALIAALRSETLGGVALDVLEEERAVKDELELLLRNRIEEGKQHVLLENHILMNMPKVILTPHIAFNSRETEEETWKVTTQNIQRFLEGNPQNTAWEFQT